ncbi:EAL domain-containing protein [bacterium CPR1]|nr:EAL domain-containing protein [bacterium CPR1]
MSQTGPPTERLLVNQPSLRDQSAWLLVLTGQSAGQLLELRSLETLVGRATTCQLALEDRGVSREHARITRCVDGSYRLSDLDSTNGTYVDGQRVVQKVLEEGDELGLGPLVKLRFGYQLSREQLDVQRRKALAGQLESALQRHELRLVYQPIVHLGSREVVGLEALPRWPREAGVVTPGEFLPAALASGLIGPLGRWVLEGAVGDLRAFQARGLKLFVTVNLSAQEASDPHLGEAYLEALARLSLAGGELVLDLPGSAWTSLTRSFLERASELNARLALQDFGTDHASLEELEELRFHQLKLDPRLVTRDEREARRVCLGGIRLAESLGARSVAVGIEAQRQLEYLAKNDCVLGQGFHLSPPVASDSIVDLVRGGTPGKEILPSL